MRLRDGARIAVVGAGPAGLAAGKHALEVGFEVVVFESSDDLGGQWHSKADHSGIWPGMRTNTSRSMTAFSDFPPPAEHELHPYAEQVHRYLHAYADRFGIVPCLRLTTEVTSVEPGTSMRPGWTVNGEPFDAVVIASGRFHAPLVPTGLAGFSGELVHAYDYPGADHFAEIRSLVYGNGVSGHEIASDIASVSRAPVISSYRKPRYVLQKVVDGVPSDWQWYTHLGALRRRVLPPDEFGRELRERVVRIAGNPADFGAPAPDEDILVAGHSLCQDYLAQVRDGTIECRPAIASIDGRRVAFDDGRLEQVDAIVCATGYELRLPFLDDAVRSVTGPELRLYRRTFHPELPGLGFVGLYATSGPYFPLLELQARLVIGTWSGAIAPPPADEMRSAVSSPPPVLDSHDNLALMFSEAACVAPDLRSRPELSEALLFGPMLPSRYRLDGPGATPDAAANFRAQLASSPRPEVDRADIDLLPRLGLADLAGAVAPAT